MEEEEEEAMWLIMHNITTNDKTTATPTCENAPLSPLSDPSSVLPAPLPVLALLNAEPGRFVAERGRVLSAEPAGQGDEIIITGLGFGGGCITWTTLTQS